MNTAQATISTVHGERPFSWVAMPANERLAFIRQHTKGDRARENYYANGKRVTINGAPMIVPKWYGELGNDAEYREATRPRTEFKAAYYEGGHRIMFDGAPMRVAAIVKTWSPWMKRALLRVGCSYAERAQAERQFKQLFGIVS